MNGIKDHLVTCFGYAMAPLLGLVSSVLAARALGPAGRGELAAIQVVPYFMIVPAVFGMGHAVAYFTARNPHRAGAVLGSALLIGLVATIPTSLIAVLLQRFLLRGYSEDIVIAGFAFVLFIPLSMIYGLTWSTLQGLGNFVAYNLLRLLPQLIYVLSILVVAACSVKSAKMVIWLYLIGTLLICVPSSWIAYSRLVADRVCLLPGMSGEMVRYGGVTMAGLLPNFLNQRLDQAFIAATLPASSLGLYATGAAFSFITVAVLGGVSAVLLPQLAARAESSSSSYLGCVLRWTIVFDLIVTVLLISLIPWGLPLAFGEEFAPAIPIAMVLALAGGFLGINTVLSEGFRGLGKPQFASLAELSSLCLTIIGLLLVLKPFGIIGAALVSLVSYMSATTIMLFLLARFDGGALADWRLLFLSELRLAQQWIWGLRKN